MKNVAKMLQIGGPAWAIQQAWLDTLMAGDIGSDFPKPAPASIMGGVAIIPIHGPMSTSGFEVDPAMGISVGTSTIMAAAQIRAAVSSAAVHHILLDVNSPGGTVVGTQYLGDAIYSARSKKPVTALSNFVMGSAAYWVGSQASEIVVVPQGEVGSIGVFGMHVDMSGAMEQQGFKPTLIYAGKYKVEGHAFGPLDETARDHLQERMDEHYMDFLAAVARGRGRTAKSVHETFGEGRMVSGKRAVALGMADKVENIEGVLGRLVRRRASGPDTRATAAWLDAAKAIANGVTIDPNRDPAVLRQRLDAKYPRSAVRVPTPMRRTQGRSASQRRDDLKDRILTWGELPCDYGF